MRALRRVAIPGLAACLALAAPVAGAAGFVYTAQSRSVSVTVDQNYQDIGPPGCCPGPLATSQGDSESATHFGDFSATAMVPPFTQSFATQTSSLKAASITANGSLAGASDLVSANYPPHWWLLTSSTLSNSFSTSFDVEVATPYQLTGSVTADGYYFAGRTTTRVTLKTAGGSVIAEGVAVSDANCDPIFCEPVAPIPVSSVGVLQPGSYVLEAVSTGGAYTFYGFGSTYLPTTSGYYSVTLDLPELVDAPSLSRGGLACLVAALVLVSLPALWLRD